MTFKPSKDEQESNDPRTLPLSPNQILEIFKKISNQDCILMGLDPEWARPEWMLITVLPVPPMPVRPSISMDGMGRGEDDLTHKLSDIIKANSALARHEAEGAPRYTPF